MSQPEVIRQVTQLLGEHPKILLVLSKELEAATPGLTTQAIQSFEKAWQNEEYYLYWVTSAQPQAAIGLSHSPQP